MASRRLIYITALILCGIFYIAYGEWLSFLILILVLALPWFSLLLSLPAIIPFRAAPSAPSVLEMGDSAELWLMGSTPWPMPPFRGRLKLTYCLTGQTRIYQDPEDLCTRHCGGVSVTAEALRVCDYLGLFSFPLRCREKNIIRIRPKPLKMELPQDLQHHISGSWKPKAGGGYAENHELRPYRPGDPLNQIHWKLSAKTGDLILREPMEPQCGLMLVTLNLQGTSAVLDRILGRLLWLGRHLLSLDLRFEIRALTGDGFFTFSIASEADLLKAVDALLCCRATQSGDLQEWAMDASWHCHIGGEPDEA